ncbi:MAG: hypothetical protein JNN15_14240, partial [Blastocatellia bacterium]|nr:hypothetical protein [Blastocatellia bacterium]
MQDNRISATLKPEDVDSILKEIESIKSQLPFLVGLTGDDIKGMVKIGNQGQQFVEKALEAGEQNLGLLPRDFDIEEAK